MTWVLLFLTRPSESAQKDCLGESRPPSSMLKLELSVFLEESQTMQHKNPMIPQGNLISFYKQSLTDVA